MKQYLKFLIGLLFLVLLLSCEADEELLTYDSEIISVKYGTSFGECLGYCNRNVAIEGTDIKFNASGQTVTGNLPEITISGVITIKDWEELIKSINILVFRNMEEVIGCPDCADGGAEWIEITTDEIKHKVIFEYNNEPDEFEGYIQELRKLIEEYESKLN